MPIRNHIITAALYSRHAKMTLITCSTTLNEAIDDLKETLYNEPMSFLKDIPSHNILCVTEDFIAKVGNDGDYCGSLR